jgi:hypothetical protein
LICRRFAVVLFSCTPPFRIKGERATEFLGVIVGFLVGDISFDFGFSLELWLGDSGMVRVYRGLLFNYN